MSTESPTETEILPTFQNEDILETTTRNLLVELTESSSNSTKQLTKSVEIKKTNQENVTLNSSNVMNINGGNVSSKNTTNDENEMAFFKELGRAIFHQYINNKEGKNNLNNKNKETVNF